MRLLVAASKVLPPQHSVELSADVDQLALFRPANSIAEHVRYDRALQHRRDSTFKFAASKTATFRSRHSIKAAAAVGGQASDIEQVPMRMPQGVSLENYIESLRTAAR
jgi:hypothetical protein